MATTTTPKIFVVDCYWCKAKVAAIETGRAECSGYDTEAEEPYACKVLVGTCPSCESIIVGKTEQIDFENLNANVDRWRDVVRVYPKPPKTFSSNRIPRVVKSSLNEADLSLQAGAPSAACVMLGRALEALCRNILDSGSIPLSKTGSSPKTTKSKKKIMLGEGIKKLKEMKVIDDRLYDWSQQLQAFRNLAAHPEDVSISREDAEDLQTFVYAIVEYVYDLAERYDEFRERVDARAKRRKK